MSAYKYSTKEWLLIDTLKVGDLAVSSSMAPHILYREMALICFRCKVVLDITVVESIRRCLSELEKVDGIKRLTEEWDNLIDV